jgi:hypothetical protein
MKISELRQIIKEEIKNVVKEDVKNVLKENIGIYMSDVNLSIIIKSLQKSKLVDQNVIEDLIHKKDVAKNILLNKKAIYKSLQINGETLGLNKEAFNMLLDKISDLNSGKATFVDYILNEEISNISGKKYNDTKIRKLIESLKFNGYIVNKIRNDADGTWAYEIKEPIDASNKRGWVIGYNAKDNMFYYNSSDPRGYTWYHSHVDTGYSFTEDAIRKVIDKLARTEPNIT